MIHSWRQGIALYGDRRLLVILAMGFSSGLPLALTTGTLAIWLAREGVDKTTIGLFALVGLPYILKFLWAPLIDRLPLPGLTRFLGRRRGWAVATQLALMGAIVGLGAIDPATSPLAMAAMALAVAFCSASQDIVIDAYRIDILADREQGGGAAMTQAGYRLGLLASGAGALYLADQVSWAWVYGIMAALVTVGIAAVLLAPEPGEGPPRGGGAKAAAGTWAGMGPWLRQTVVAPFEEFLTRRGWLAILAFILLYKFGDAFAAVMANPFYVEMGFSNTEIANVSKIFGLAATVGGIFAGGVLVARIGIMPSLVLCGILQMASNLMFAAQAAIGHDTGFLAATVFAENFSGGLGSAAFVAYLSVLCNASFSATQYALLSSFMAVGRTVLSSSSGWFADHMDWISFFLLSTGLALPGLLMLWWMMRVYPLAERRSV